MRLLLVMARLCAIFKIMPLNTLCKEAPGDGVPFSLTGFPEVAHEPLWETRG